MMVLGSQELKISLTVILFIVLQSKQNQCQIYYIPLQYNQQMRGVNINNYIDNRIMLSGRKIKNQVQTVIQSHRPKPLIVNHLNQIQPEEEIITEERSPKQPQLQLASNKKRKKRTKTITNNANTGQPKSTKNRVSLSLQQLKKGLTSAKKKSNQSSPSKDSEINQLAQTQRKLKPVYKSPSQGLGKRSKSAIIKNTRVTEKDKEKIDKILEDQRSKKRKQKKKQNKEKQREKQKQKEKEKKKPSHHKKEKERKNISINDIKKVPSSMNLSTKSKKKAKSSEKKKKLSIKSTLTSAHQSKPISARDKRGNISKKLFSYKKESPLKILDYRKQINEKNEEQNVKKIMNELESALNTISNKKKLSKELEMIKEKLKDLAIESPSSSEEEDSENNLNNITKQKQKLIEESQEEDESEKTEILYEEIEENDNEIENEELFMDKNKEISKIEHKQSGLDSQQKGQDINLNIGNQIVITNESKVSIQKIQENQKQQQNAKYVQQEEKEEIREIQNDFHEEDEGEEYLRNPIVGRRGYNEVQLDIEYDSIKSHDERQNEIEMLKRFKQQSNKMMEKVEKKNEKKQLEIKAEVQVKVQEKSKQKTPKNAQIYAFEKYPKISDIKSPKVNQQQIVDIINLKQKVDDDRHNKLSELVYVMHDKKLVSPKTFETQLSILKRKKQQENQMLQNYKKHAEELSKLLSDIKKEKQQIYGIDQLIREEKWDQAMVLVQKNKEQSQKSDLKEEKHTLPRQQSKGKVIEDESESEKSEHIYYSGDHSDDGSSAIKLQLIPVEDEGEKDENLIVPSENQSSVIKIDEGEEKPVRKGFESNLYFIKEYCIALCEFVRDRYGKDFKESIGLPLQFNLPVLLKSYRTLKNGDQAQKINSIYEDLCYHKIYRQSDIPPISVEIFNQFNEFYENIKYYGKEESRDAQLEGIFLRSIYNALNESLNNQRPGGLNGKALPWAHTSKHLKNHKNKISYKESRRSEYETADSEDLIFGIAIARIIQWGSCLCGFIPDTAELQNTEIDEEYVNHIRETRMALLLQKMLAEEENEMAENELEQTEVKLSIAKLVFEELLVSETEQLHKIGKRKILREIDY